MTPLSDVKNAFQFHLGKPVNSKLEHGTFIQVDSRWRVTQPKVCKLCHKPYATIPKCCDNTMYNHGILVGDRNKIFDSLGEIKNGQYHMYPESAHRAFVLISTPTAAQDPDTHHHKNKNVGRCCKMSIVQIFFQINNYCSFISPLSTKTSPV